jgi:hypothetical protein
MKKILILFGLIAMIFLTIAQPVKEKKPDFSGAWIEVSPWGSPQQGHGANSNLGCGWGKQFTIVQTQNALTVERVFFTRGDIQPPLKYRFSLNGEETRNTILMGRGYQEQVSKAEWDGDKLVIKTIFKSQIPVDGKRVTCEVTQILSINVVNSRPFWRSLIIETRRGGVLGGPSSTTRTVYNKN